MVIRSYGNSEICISYFRISYFILLRFTIHDSRPISTAVALAQELVYDMGYVKI